MLYTFRESFGKNKEIIKIISFFVRVAIPTEAIGITRPEIIIVLENIPAI